jgi:hypothetical protein
MDRRTILVMLMAITMSGGCMNLPRADISETAERWPLDTGLLVGSITQTSDGDPNPFHEKVGFVFGPKDGSDVFGLNTFQLKSGQDTRPFLYPKSWLEDRGLEDVNGRLFATALRPGVYALLGFYVDAPGYQYHRFANPIAFEVTSGEVLYLGNFHAACCIRHAYANQYGVAGIQLSVNDKSSRDYPLLRNKFISLRNVDIDKRLLNNDELEQQAMKLSKWCDCERNCYSDL